MVDMEEPTAYAFEYTVEDDARPWVDKVEFKHPDETFGSHEGFEVRNVRPLYEEDE